jgi:hypothetical protein
MPSDRRFGLIKVVKYSSVPHFLRQEGGTSTRYTEAARFPTEEEARFILRELVGWYRVWDFQRECALDDP